MNNCSIFDKLKIQIMTLETLQDLESAKNESYNLGSDQTLAAFQASIKLAKQYVEEKSLNHAKEAFEYAKFFGDDAGNNESFEKVGQLISDLTVKLKKEYNKLGELAEKALGKSPKKALNIYRSMLGKDPSDQSVKDRIKEIELKLNPPPKEKPKPKDNEITISDLSENVQKVVDKMAKYIAQASTNAKQRRVLYAKQVCEKLIKKTLVE